jgi:superfamily II DNA or RNA helicase
MELRKYQSDIIKKTINTTSNDMIQLATGGGKTIIAGYICNTYIKENKKVLFLAHREELITQPKENFFSQFCIDASIIKASKKSDLSLNVQIASVQTFHKRLNFKPNLIIIDEAHHSTASTYQKIIKHYPNARIIGLTATPYRLSGKGFKGIFNRLINSISIKELENSDYLVPAKCYSYPIGHNKLNRIKLKGGDYNEKDLDKIMNDRVLIEDIVVSYEKHAKGKKMIVFASTVKHSQAICKRFKEFGINALHIDATTKNRSLIIDEFRFGETNILCNVGIVTEGLDIATIECVCLARPTKSLALYLQMCGRGSRKIQGKNEYILLDHTYNYFEHGSPNKSHHWNKYFKGTIRGNIAKPKSNSFKLIYEGKELIINDILAIPADIKGFVLEEVESEIKIKLSKNIKRVGKNKSKTYKCVVCNTDIRVGCSKKEDNICGMCRSKIKSRKKYYGDNEPTDYEAAKKYQMFRGLPINYIIDKDPNNAT